MLHRSAPLLAGCAAILLALTGCTGASPVPTRTPAVTATATTTVTTTASPPSTPPSTPPSSTAPVSTGCPADNGTLPTDADARPIGDVDGDGRADRVFSAAAKGEFGIVTASGAHLSVMYETGSSDTRVAWAARLDGGAGILMTSDGRVATMWSIQHGSRACGLMSVRNVQGKPYEFLLQRRNDAAGSGVGCRSERGRTVLGGYAVRPVTSTTSRVTFTRVDVAADGRSATNGATELIAASTPDDSAVVAGAEGSGCLDAPLVTLP